MHQLKRRNRPPGSPGRMVFDGRRSRWRWCLFFPPPQQRQTQSKINCVIQLSTKLLDHISMILMGVQADALIFDQAVLRANTNDLVYGVSTRLPVTKTHCSLFTQQFSLFMVPFAFPMLPRPMARAATHQKDVVYFPLILVLWKHNSNKMRLGNIFNTRPKSLCSLLFAKTMMEEGEFINTRDGSRATFP